ncbi:LamG-like jellyroll fold domain-containing protein [uncultured Fibrobacter sp.]|uniref:LamG-like jellyroll fold domain-containing protein n=1 Tax=uncultured Fibrobacter sp. TaxID=261512 RepID=UPI0025EC583E|nr:LamG-like jellyroll fold domain-containing protein [uncultured Fibrobacter sp.]
MKNFEGFALAAALGVLAGCSTSPSDSSSWGTVSEELSTVNNIARVNVVDAHSHLARYRHFVVDSWQLSDSTSDTASVVVDSLTNYGFAVEADVQVEDDSAYTIASAGVDGDSAAWVLQVEEGAVVYSWRNTADENWLKFKTEKALDLKKLNTVRVERAGVVVAIIVNGKIIDAFKDDGKSAVIKGLFTIGFDARNPGKCHCNNGRVEQIGVETVDEIEDSPIDSVQVIDTLDIPLDTSAALNDSEVTEWIAEWNFNDAENVGLDVTGHGHNATAGEGSVSAVDGIASFDGKSGMVVSLDTDIRINEFVVEARVKPTQFATMQNIIVAEPPGRGVDGWQLRIDEGVLTVHLRDADSSYVDWSIYPGKEMILGEWNEIRLERNADSVKLFQNGELTVAVAYQGDLTQMCYDWGIGYDAMQQSFHDRYFIGEMDYIRFGVFKGFTEGTLVPKNEWLLAAWEFNEPEFVGLDRMANNSSKYVVGNAVVADTTLVLDGQSGMPVNLSRAFQRNTFAIETRVKPAAFAEMQNIIVAEPPGRYGDGWIVRLDDGVLTVHFRDEETDGTEWNVLKGKELALDEWTEIRVERTADSVIVFQNGERSVWAAAKGDVSQLGYNIGIGYDAMKQAKGNRYFNGEIDYIRYYGL